MKILNLKKDQMKVLVETPEDLIILDSIINKDDIIGGETIRVIKFEKEQRKRKVYLKIRVEKKKFTEDSLRITGKIIEGPEEIERGYHTFEIKEGTVIEIFKKIDEFTLRKIKESERFKKKIIVFTVDYGKISIFEVTNYSIKEIFEKEFGIPGKNEPKEREKAIEDFLKFVNRLIEDYSKENKYVIVVGNKFLLEKINCKFKVESPHYGIVAVKEIFKRREIIEIIKDMDITNAEEVFEEFFGRLLKGDERIAYGIENIKSIVEEGRIERAVFLRKIIKEDLDLLKKIEEFGGKYYIVDEETEVGKKVKNFGEGIAILRW